MKRGLAPDGTHLYPAFPYTSYQRMPVADLVDLKAFLDTLPAAHAPDKQNQLPFPLTIRRGIGLWKLLFLDGREFMPDPAKSAEVNRGAYLVEGPGHCNECHTPRTLFGLGGLDYSHALGGAPNPTGRGRAANLTPGKNGLGKQSPDDLLDDLEMGGNFGPTMGRGSGEPRSPAGERPQGDHRLPEAAAAGGRSAAGGRAVPARRRRPAPRAAEVSSPRACASDGGP